MSIPPPHRRRRSALYLPASNARAIDKARTAGADVVILDLEDAVAPDAKAVARDQAVAALATGGFGAAEVIVRVNAGDTPWGADDLAALAGTAAVLLPKVSGATDLVAATTALGSSTALWAMIETPRAIVHLADIASASVPLAGLVVGTNDLAKEARFAPDRALLTPILVSVVLAARAYDNAVLDGVFNVLDDPDGLAAECRAARRLGFDGKTLIHPSQIAPCHAAFAPTAEELEEAREIAARFDDPQNIGKGAVRHRGRMVERLHAEQARALIAEAAEGAEA